MATLPYAPCPHPHCRRLTRGGPCATHRRAREQRRGSARARGNDAEWQATSRAWLSRYPWCGQRAGGQLHAEHSRCVRRGLRIRATITDHIQPLREGGARLDPANLQSLCVSCNTRKG